jgi:hypothetical protein
MRISEYAGSGFRKEHLVSSDGRELVADLIASRAAAATPAPLRETFQTSDGGLRERSLGKNRQSRTQCARRFLEVMVQINSGGVVNSSAGIAAVPHWSAN